MLTNSYIPDGPHSAKRYYFLCELDYYVYLRVRHNSKDNLMAIFDLFSKRQKRLRGEVPDIYTYDDIPQSLRVQIVHIIRDCIGERKDYMMTKQEKLTNLFITRFVENMGSLI